MRRATLALAALVCLPLAACAPQQESTADDGAQQTTLRIAAAASLNGVFEEIVADFEAENPDVDVEPVIYDGSSTLATQIAEGAPIDVAAFADERTMQQIADDIDEPRVFATNTLVIVAPEGQDAVASLDDLADPDLDVVLCAAEVPCGAATAQALDDGGLEVRAASSEQNVTAVLRKVENGAADAGLVYRTDAQASDAVDTIEDARLDGVVNRYPIAVTAGAGPAAERFVDWVLSEDAQARLASWGLGAP